MVSENRVTFRLSAEQLRVLRRLGELGGVSADLICQRVVVDLLPELERIVTDAEDLRDKHDPAGRGYIVWSIQFPDPELVQDQPAYQPSGGFTALHIGEKTAVRGIAVLTVPEPAEQPTDYELVTNERTSMHLFERNAGRPVPAGE